MPGSVHDLLVIERILRDRGGIWCQVHDKRDLKALIVRMATSSIISLACYGAVLGASHSAVQALSSAVKLPILFVVTIAICLPTLYLFNLVFGARLSVSQALALVLLAVTVTSVLSLTFAPISLFFLVTAPQYEFYKLLNVAILLLTALVGLRFLISGMNGLNRLARLGAQPSEERDPAQSAQSEGNTAAPTLLYVWVLLFGFVGTQLGWTLRPFVGSPGEPFQIFRPIGGNFYVDIVRTIAHM